MAKKKRQNPIGPFVKEVTETIDRMVAEGRIKRAGDTLKLTDKGWLHVLAEKAAAIPDGLIGCLEALIDEDARPEEAADVAALRELQASGRQVLKLKGWEKERTK